MTRKEKIEALANDYMQTRDPISSDIDFKAGILAGIALRDAELLEMEFNECRAYSAADDDYFPSLQFEKGARWQHEQFMKTIKGDGDG